MHLHVITRVLVLVVCMYMCVAAVSSMPIYPTDYLTRGTVYFPGRDRRNYVPVEPGMMDHLCVLKPSFYCMCTSNGYVSYCENHTSSYFTEK